MRRGEVAQKPIWVSKFTPALFMLYEQWEKSKYFRGKLPEWISVNPTTNISFLNSDDLVSFIPMEAVAEDGAGIETQNIAYEKVAQGYTRFSENDLIWAKITPCMQNGKSGVARNLSFGVGFGSTEFHVLRPKSEEVNIDFIKHLLTLESFLTAAQGTFSGTAGQQRVPEQFLLELPLPLPPINVQRSLVAEMETARAMRQSKLAQAESLLKGIDQFVLDELGLKLPKKIERKSYATRLKHIKTAQTLNSDYFHPERMNALKTIQRNSPRLRVERLADIADFIRDITTVQEDDNYIGLASVQSNTGELVEVEETAEGQCFRYQKNDVLFGRLRPYLNKIRCAEEDGVCSTEFHVIRLRKRSNPKEEISPEYLAVILRSSIILAQTKHMMTGNTHPRLTNDDVVNLIVPIPRDIKAQSKIVTELQKRRSQARSLREEAERQWREAKEKFEKALLG
ncbi:MAG TPA: restriction endonuclease subunit S [Anaerolineales bacterium]|nr:restriction endonuclease subunit S [Anaerolineales bacterium]